MFLQAVAKDAPTEEIERAKNAAVSAILINLESRAVVNEDIGRQILTYGHRYKRCSLAKHVFVALPAADVNA